MSDDRPVPPSGAEPTAPLPQHGQTQPMPPGGWRPPPPPAGQVPPPTGWASTPPPGQAPPPPVGPASPAPAAWQNPTYTDYRPGTIPLRPLTMSDVFGGVVTTIRGNLAATLGLGLLVTAIAVIPATALGIWWARSGSFDFQGINESDSAELATLAGSTLPTLAQAFVVFVTAAFMVWVIGQGAIGRRVTPGQVWAGTRGRLLPVLGTVLLTMLVFAVPFAVFFAALLAVLVSSDGSGAAVALLAFVGVFALIAWSVYAWVKTAFATSACILEEAGPLTALKRSWRLTRGQFWRLFGIRFLAAVALAIVSAIITFPVTAVVDALTGSAGAGGGDRIVWGVFASALGTILAGILTTPFSAGVDALLYIDQRMRKEGLDVQLMRAAQGQAG